MNNKNLIDQIKKAALLDDKKRMDIRYKIAMAFLVKKGFLKTNLRFEKFYQARVRVKDLIWAGQNVEPRILEVLPAAVIRLPKAFILENTNAEMELKQVIADLKENKMVGKDFLKMPYAKIKIWLNISLNDRRTKILNSKKVMKSFRLNPQTIIKMELIKKKSGLSDASIIEKLVEKELVD